jgi:hypothetical protein
MMGNNMTIGGHGYKNIRLGKLSYKNQLIEINLILMLLIVPLQIMINTVIEL